MIDPFECQDSEVLIRTPIFDLRADRVTHPVSGRLQTVYVLETRPYVNIVAVTTEGRVVLVRQWRHGVREAALEIPAGLGDPGESPEETAARELTEETGYVAERLTNLGSVQPNPAHQDNVCVTILAEGCRPFAATSFDEGEAIEVELVEVDQLAGLVRSGEIRSALVICALFAWLQHRGGLDWSAALNAPTGS